MRELPVTLTLAFLLTLVLAAACGNSKEPLTISDVWARSSAKSAEVGVMYFSVVNNSNQADTLTGVSTTITPMTELHRTVKVNDVMTMEPVPNQRLDIPAGEKMKFVPGGYHVMLMKLPAPLKAGDSFEATLHFENAGDINVTVPIKD